MEQKERKNSKYWRVVRSKLAVVAFFCALTAFVPFAHAETVQYVTVMDQNSCDNGSITLTHQTFGDRSSAIDFTQANGTTTALSIQTDVAISIEPTAPTYMEIWTKNITTGEKEFFIASSTQNVASSTYLPYTYTFSNIQLVKNTAYLITLRTNAAYYALGVDVAVRKAGLCDLLTPTYQVNYTYEYSGEHLTLLNDTYDPDWFSGTTTITGEGLLGEETTTPTVPIAKNIEILQPTYGTTTATTTFALKIKYKTPFSFDFRPTTTRHYEISDAVTGEIQYVYNATVIANTSENIEINATNTLPIGSKYIRAMYLDELGNIYSEVDEVFFNVATNTYFAATGIETPRDNPNSLTQIDCGTFEIGCQFQKALLFLFQPKNTTLDKFSNIWQTIATKKPFGYVTVTIEQLASLDETGTRAFDLGTIPFMDSIFTPFRDAMSGILWAIFAIYFFLYRLRHLDI